MFTGIIEDTGRIKVIRPFGRGKRVTLASNMKERINPGESIAVDGVCFTVEEVKGSDFEIYISEETLRVTKFGKMLRVGMRVNLERSLVYGDRLGGHIVTGHIDSVGRISKIIPHSGSALWEIELVQRDYMKYLVKKGSVAVDGVSLTVNDISERGFSVQLIPYTLERTNFLDRRVGDLVNLEFDLLGKYIESILKERKSL
jgi:riboflavin synthase